jgi:hypothetical protein
MASGQSMPVHPPMPALQITASSFGVVSRRRLASLCTDSKLSRSSRSCRKCTRPCSTCEIPGSVRSCFSNTWRKCFCSFAIAASPFRWSRVVMMRTRDSVCGRVWRNSSIKRVPMPSPRPLDRRQLNVCVRFGKARTCLRL